MLKTGKSFFSFFWSNLTEELVFQVCIFIINIGSISDLYSKFVYLLFGKWHSDFYNVMAQWFLQSQPININSPIGKVLLKSHIKQSLNVERLQEYQNKCVFLYHLIIFSMLVRFEGSWGYCHRTIWKISNSE